MRRAFLIGFGVLTAYALGVVTIPVALHLAAPEPSSAGTEISWTPERGWQTREISRPAPLVPPADAQLAGIVGNVDVDRDSLPTPGDP
jgi:hypothetical protein